MFEVGKEIGKYQEVKEYQVPQPENFRRIKPEGNVTSSDAKEFWNAQFSGKSSFSEKSAEVGGGKIYQDDNNKTYRIGDRLKSNERFEINGYTYETDKNGRIKTAEGKLRLPSKEEKNNHKNMDSMEAVGKGDQLKTDQRGHLIGDRFGGRGGIENLSPMSGELNQKDYNKLETLWADAIKNGSQVEVKIQPRYEGKSNRPSEYRVSYSIDGERSITVFKNGKEN